MTPERQAQIAVVKWLRHVLPRGSLVNSVSNERGALGQTEAQRMHFGMARRQTGTVAGWPDLQIFLPGGRALFLEMKRPKGGEIAIRQSEIHQQLRALGYYVGVATSIETARFCMQEAGVSLNETAGQLVKAAKVRVSKRGAITHDPVPF